jgi:hypothetical protein
MVVAAYGTHAESGPMIEGSQWIQGLQRGDAEDRLKEFFAEHKTEAVSIHRTKNPTGAIR